MKTIPYIGCIILLIIVLLQNKSCDNDVVIDSPKIDTVIVIDTVRDTIPGKPILIKTKIDTSIWIKKSEYKPDTTYKGLYNQYTSLGNKHFSTNIFKTTFPISDYGSVTLTDSIRENQLVNTTLTTNLNIPTTTITIEKTAPPKRQLYIGTTFLGNKSSLLSSVHGGLILKDKKDHLYGVSIGYNGEVVFGGTLYFPIRLKK